MTTDRSFIWITAAVVVVVATAETVATQSLGDLARREEERRKATTTSRLYTNADLDAVASAQSTTPLPANAPTLPPDGGESLKPTTPVPAKYANIPGVEPIIIEGREKRDEQYWRQRARDIRDRVARATADVEGAQMRLADLDNGPQTAATVRERDVAAKSLAQLQATLGFRRDELAKFEAFARASNAQPDWIR